MQEDLEHVETHRPNGLQLLFTWAKEDIKRWWLAFWPIE